MTESLTGGVIPEGSTLREGEPGDTVAGVYRLTLVFGGKREPTVTPPNDRT